METHHFQGSMLNFRRVGPRYTASSHATHGSFPARASGLRTTRAFVGRKAGLKAKS